MKVAINRCFGGFGLSDEGFEELLERKGIVFEYVKSESAFLGNAYYRAGHVGEEEHYLSPWQFTEDRSEADLIAVLEAMGKKAWGFASEIAIIDIPDGVKWHISEYDGLEHIAEDHRTWT